MKTKIVRYIKEIILFSFMLLLLTNAISLYKSMDLNKQSLSIKEFTLLDGSTYRVTSNKPLLVHFWATWCPTCKLEASNINFLSKHFNVLTIAVNSKTNADIQRYMKEHDYTFKVVNDTQGFLASKFKIAGFPTTFIYDKKKNLVFSEVGYTSAIGLYLRMWWASL